MVRAECRHELLARPRELGIGFGPALRGLQVLREADAEQALLGALGRQRARNALDDVAMHRLRFRELAAFAQQPGEVVLEDQHVEVVGAEQLALDSERAPVERLGFVELALQREHEPEVVQAVARRFVAVAERRLALREHFTEQRFRGCVLLRVLQHARELVLRVLHLPVCVAEDAGARGQHLALDRDRVVGAPGVAQRHREVLALGDRRDRVRAVAALVPREHGALLALRILVAAELLQAERELAACAHRHRMCVAECRRDARDECGERRDGRVRIAREIGQPRKLHLPAPGILDIARRPGGVAQLDRNRLRVVVARVELGGFRELRADRARRHGVARRERQCAVELLAPAVVAADPHVARAERAADRGLHGGLAREARADARSRRIEHFFDAHVAAAGAVRVRGRQQVFGEERVHGGRGLRFARGTRRLALRAQREPRRDADAGDEHRHQRALPAATHVLALGIRAQSFGLGKRRALGRALRASRVERAQALRELARVGQPTTRVDVGRRRDVLAQHLVVDVAFPARAERLREVADRELVQHHAERIHVGARGGRLARHDFRREVERRARRVVAGARAREAMARDAERREPLGIEQRADTEVAQDRARRVAGFAHEHVARLQVLVQHADAMRGRHRLGALRNEVEALRERRIGMRRVPLGEVAARDELRLDVVRRLIGVPVEDAHDGGIVAERFAQHAVQRDFALERGERRAVARVLEHALLARLRMLGQPYERMAALAERAHQPPVRSMRHRVPGMRLERARLARHARLHGHAEPIAVAVHGADHGLLVVAEQRAQLHHALREHAFGDHAPGPDGIEQLVLRERLARTARELHEHVERFCLHRHGMPADAQLAHAFVELGRAEAVDRGAGFGDRGHGSGRA